MADEEERRRQARNARRRATHERQTSEVARWRNENLGNNRILLNDPSYNWLTSSAGGIQHDTSSGTHQQGNRRACPTDDEWEHMTEESRAEFRASLQREEAAECNSLMSHSENLSGHQNNLTAFSEQLRVHGDRVDQSNHHRRKSGEHMRSLYVEEGRRRAASAAATTTSTGSTQFSSSTGQATVESSPLASIIDHGNHMSQFIATEVPVQGVQDIAAHGQEQEEDSKPAATTTETDNDENFDPELLDMEQMFLDMFNIDDQPDLTPPNRTMFD